MLEHPTYPMTEADPVPSFLARHKASWKELIFRLSFENKGGSASKYWNLRIRATLVSSQLVSTQSDLPLVEASFWHLAYWVKENDSLMRKFLVCRISGIYFKQNGLSCIVQGGGNQSFGYVIAEWDKIEKWIILSRSWFQQDQFRIFSRVFLNSNQDIRCFQGLSKIWVSKIEKSEAR